MFPDPSSASAQLYERACKVLPGGNTRTSLFWPPYQIYALAGSGARVVDADGVERIDFHNNFTALIHGHAHPVIVERVQDQLSRGACFGLATESEISLAELLCSRAQSFESIRFTNSGTEACINLIKAARGYTGRPKFAKCEGVYHGSSEALGVSVMSAPHNWGEQRPAVLPESRGTPKGVLADVVVIPFNETESAERILTEHASELAGVIIDPVPVRAGMIPATREFLAMLRDFTRRTGSLLMFDEVLNFRLGYGGAQTEFSIEPDLTALGKIIGGGFPIGAIAGKKEVMSVFDPREGYTVWHGGTFNGNPISMVAGFASMQLLTPKAFARLAKLGQLARDRISQAFQAAGVHGQVTGLASLFRIHCSIRTLSNYRSFYPSPAEQKQVDWLVRYLLNHGILLNRIGVGAVSTVMSEEEIEQLGETLFTGLQLMKKEIIDAA